MTDPDRSEWQTVWLGKDGTTPPEKGWYPVEGEVRTTRLATFERKVTIGDATRDSDDFISSYVIGDFSGGGQILDINEGSDTDRFWWGVADTRFQNQTSLPPEVVANTLTGTAGSGFSNVARPLGDVPNINGTSTVFHVHYNGKAHGMTSSGFTSGAVMGSNVNVPNHIGVPFWGPSSSTSTTIAGPVLVIPSTTAAYYLFSTTDGGSLTAINCNVGTGTAPIDLPYICVFNDILYGIDSNMYLWTSANARVWNKVYSTGTTQLRIPKGQLCRKLTSHMVGVDPKLLVVTDEQVWMLSTVAGGSDLMWVDTPIHYPTSPSNGLGVTRWRQGEDLWINVGPDLLRLTTSNVIVPNNGPIRDDGLPADMYEQGSSYAQATTISSLVGDHNFLYALLVHNNGSKYPDLSVMAWTGTGWHCLWQGGSAPIGVYVGVENFWMALSRGPQSNLHQDYYLMIGTAEQKVYSMKLRTTFHNVKAGARAGIDRYSTTTALVGSTSGTQNPWVETGRFDANMVGFKKLASHIQVGMEYADTNNGIKLYYQTDASVPATVSTADYSIGWTQIPADKSLINKVGLTTIELPGEAGFNKGIPFQWIRFKVEFVGNSATKTPILNHLVLSYTKVPQDAASFILTIPLPRETFMGRTGQEMADDLLDLLTTQEYIKLVHQNRTYRVRVAGVSGADSTGSDYAGARTVNLIEIGG